MSINDTHGTVADPFRYQHALTRAVTEYMQTEGKTQEYLAELLSLKQASISRRFTGKTPWTLGDVALLVDAGVLSPSVLEVA